MPSSLVLALRAAVRAAVRLVPTVGAIGAAACATVAGPVLAPPGPGDRIVVGLVASHDGLEGSHDRYATAIRDARAALDHVARCGGLDRADVHLYVAGRVTLGERTVDRRGDATIVLADGSREPAVVALDAEAQDPVAAVAKMAARYLDAPACAATGDG